MEEDYKAYCKREKIKRDKKVEKINKYVSEEELIQKLSEFYEFKIEGFETNKLTQVNVCFDNRNKCLKLLTLSCDRDDSDSLELLSYIWLSDSIAEIKAKLHEYKFS